MSAILDGVLVSEPIPDGHINLMELFALMQVFDLFKNWLELGVLTWRVDNNSALFAIRNQGSMRSWNLSWLAVQIVEKAHSMDITITPIRVSSEENLLANRASRNVQIADCSLKQSVAERI